MARAARKSAAVDPFFDEPQGAAKLKHEVLRHHLRIYANKTGRRTPVVFLDGYAGPGRYGDGSPGSPKLMVDAARALREHRDIHCIFVEEDPNHWEQLKVMLAELGDDDSEPLRGRLEDHLDEILSKTAGKSLHVFLDPYGLAIPFRMLVGMLRRRPRNGPSGFQPTEIILNFSINGITRAAGRLDRRHEDPTTERARETRLRGLEEFLDGQWWHPIWRAGESDRVTRILDGYLVRFRAEMRGWKTLPVPVADRWNGPPSYYLVVLTEHEQGLWYFTNSVSYGSEALHGHTHSLQPTLFDPEVEESWPAQIERNITGLLARDRSFRLVDEITEVYGATLGRARERHVRDALKHLWAQGRIGTNPRGCRDLFNLRVLPPSAG